ncbi:MAG: WD40 repeat domain-containing protein [Verrucomicrobiales bacterium]|nr:WD40 repeat domain-containing protein [Verrucomicrobiales bacterium]
MALLAVLFLHLLVLKADCIPFASPIRTFGGSWVWSFDVSPDGSKLAIGEEAPESGVWRAFASVWDIRSGEQLISVASPDNTTTVEFAPDGSRLLIGASRLIELELSTNLSMEFGVSNEWVKTVRFLPGQDEVFTLSQRQHGGTGRLWDARTGQQLAQHEDLIAVSGDGLLAMRARAHEGVRVIDTVTGETRAVWADVTGRWIEHWNQEIAGAEFGSGNEFVYFVADGLHVLEPQEVLILNVHTGEIAGRYPGYLPLAFSPDGTLMATSVANYSWREDWQCDSECDKVILRRADSGSEVRRFKGALRKDSMGFGVCFALANSIEFSADARYVLTAAGTPTDQANNAIAELWEVESGRLIAAFDRGLRALFVPGGKEVAVLRMGGPVQLFDIRFFLVNLRHAATDDGAEIHWDLGILQFANAPSGPWADLPAASPFRLSTVGGQGFFRVKVNE